MELITKRIKELEGRCKHLELENESLHDQRKCDANHVFVLQKNLSASQAFIRSLKQLLSCYENNSPQEKINCCKIRVKCAEDDVNKWKKQLDYCLTGNKSTECLTKGCSNKKTSTDHTYSTAAKTKPHIVLNKNNKSVDEKNKGSDNLLVFNSVVEPLVTPIPIIKTELSDNEDTRSVCGDDNLDVKEKPSSASSFLLASELLLSKTALKSRGKNDTENDSSILRIDLSDDSDQGSAKNEDFTQDNNNRNKNNNNNSDTFSRYYIGLNDNRIIDFTPKSPKNKSHAGKEVDSKKRSHSSIKKKGVNDCNKNNGKINGIKNNSADGGMKNTPKIKMKIKLKFDSFGGFNSKKVKESPKLTPSKKLINPKEKKNANTINVRGLGDYHCPMVDCTRRYHQHFNLIRHIKEVHGEAKAAAFQKEINKQLNIAKLVANQKSCENLPQTVSEIRVNSSSFREPGKCSLTNRWICDFPKCGRSYTEKGKLKTHQLNIHKKISYNIFAHSVKKSAPFFKVSTNKKTDDLWVCDHKGCMKKYSTKGNLIKHQKAVHRKLNFSKTPRSHHFNNKINFPSRNDSKCDDYESESNTNSDSVKRKYEANFSCDICGINYRYKARLEQHIKCHLKKGPNLKTRVRPQMNAKPKRIYECPFAPCQFRTSSKPDLVKHFSVHRPETYEYKCLIPSCNYSASVLKALKNHVLNRHTEQQFFRAMEEAGVHYPDW